MGRLGHILAWGIVVAGLFLSAASVCAQETASIPEPPVPAAEPEPSQSGEASGDTAGEASGDTAGDTSGDTLGDTAGDTLGDGATEELQTQPPDYFRLGPQAADVEPPGKTRRWVRIAALGLTSYAFLAATPGLALGLDLALYGQEFHDQARTFSMMNATLSTFFAVTAIWPIAIALDGNGDPLWTSLGAALAGGSAIAAMYLYAQDDPDKLLAQSFTPGVMAFVTGIVIYELTSDTSREYRDETGRGDAWVGLSPVDGGLRGSVGFAW